MNSVDILTIGNKTIKVGDIVKFTIGDDLWIVGIVIKLENHRDMWMADVGYSHHNIFRAPFAARWIMIDELTVMTESDIVLWTLENA